MAGGIGMAISKKEKQMIEDLQIRLALHFTEKVEPDIAIPDDYDVIKNGYSFNSYNHNITKSCSSAICHSSVGWDKTTSQRPIKQYSSILLALKAMRNELEYKFAKELGNIDVLIQIEKERTKGK